MLRTLAVSYWAAEERRDIDAVMAHYHQDATYQDGAGRCQGATEIREFYVGSVTAYPVLRVAILREYAHMDADTAVDRDAAAGARPAAGAFEFEAVLTDPQGRDWVIRGVNIFHVRDGRFTSVRSYEDPPAPAGP